MSADQPRMFSPEYFMHPKAKAGPNRETVKSSQPSLEEYLSAQPDPHIPSSSDEDDEDGKAPANSRDIPDCIADTDEEDDDHTGGGLSKRKKPTQKPRKTPKAVLRAQKKGPVKTGAVEPGGGEGEVDVLIADTDDDDDDDEMAGENELEEEEEEEAVWTGEEKWPQLDNPPFTSKDEPLVLSPLGKPLVQVPSHIAKYLRTYQLEGVKFLYRKYAEDTGCILGDDMGLGKTTQTTAFLIAVLGKKGTSEDICTASQLSQRTDKAHPVLIACPASIMNQWRSELLVWSFFRVGICNGKDKEECVQRLLKGEIEVMIISYDGFRRDFERLNTVDWQCVIFDEAHKVKNHKSSLTQAANSLRCMRRIGLTGTLLQNHMHELHTTLSWAVPRSLGEWGAFKMFYEKPIKMGQAQDAFDELILRARDRAKQLKGIIDEHVLRRDKCMIADQVPGKEDWIVVCPMASVQSEVYKRVLAHPDYERMRLAHHPCDCRSGDDRGKCCYKWIDKKDFTIFDTRDAKDAVTDEAPSGCLKWHYFLLAGIIEVCKICNHLDLIRVNRKEPKRKQEKDLLFAKQAFNTDDPDAVEQQNILIKMCSDDQCGKMQVLKRLLEKFYSQKDKVLIFSYSVRMLDILQRFVEFLGHTFLRLDGNTPPSKRLKIVTQYNTDPEKFIMLLSTKAGGLGINLTSANVVVIIDPNWNPSHDLQAQDRAFRIGQRRHVKVFRLLSAGTIEEVVYQRQIYKQQLVNISVEASHERRYFSGVEGDQAKKGELWGVENLFTWRPTAQGNTDTGRMLEREKDKGMPPGVEVKQDLRAEVTGGVGAKEKVAGGGGEDEEDEEAGWVSAVKGAVKELVEGEGAVDEVKSTSNKGGGGQSVMDILEIMTWHTHKHGDVVGESEKEVETAGRLRGMMKSRSISMAPDIGISSKGKAVGRPSNAAGGASSRINPPEKKQRVSDADDDVFLEDCEEKCQRIFKTSFAKFMEMLEEFPEEEQEKHLLALCRAKEGPE